MKNLSQSNPAAYLLEEDLVLQPDDVSRLAILCGPLEEHLQQIEKSLNISIRHRGSHFFLVGDSGSVSQAKKVLQQLYEETTGKRELSRENIHHQLLHVKDRHNLAPLDIICKKKKVSTFTIGQRRMIETIREHALTFVTGPAGTGKTFLASACALEALEKHQVERLVLVRPAVETDEKLGFLPGDLESKVDPYLRPLYDALIQLAGPREVNSLTEYGKVEVAPLAYMRGRNLDHCWIILDEAQNTTPRQMKMFLTRMGNDTKIVVTGDISQVDLAPGKDSGLTHAVNILNNINDIGIVNLTSRDIVRHELVRKVVDAYEKHRS